MEWKTQRWNYFWGRRKEKEVKFELYLCYIVSQLSYMTFR